MLNTVSTPGSDDGLARFIVWLVVGLLIYFLYSRHLSEFADLPNLSR